MSILPKLNKTIYHLRIPLLCAVISLIGMILRFKRLANRDFWGDELYQINISSGPFKHFWLHNLYGDFSYFPGEYIITFPFLQYFGTNKWGLMIPHIIFAFVGFYFLYLLCQRYFKTTLGFVIAFALVAFNETLIYYNFEFRPYGVLPTLAIGGLFFAKRLFSDFSRLTKWYKFGIGFFYAFTVIFHVYGLIFLSLIFLFQFLANYKESDAEMYKASFKKYFSSLYLILGMLWVWYASPNLELFGYVPLIKAERPTFDYIPNPIVDFIGFFKSIMGNLLTLSIKWLKWVILGMVCVLFSKNVQRYKQLGFFFICIVLGIQLVFLSILFKHYWFTQRQFVWVIPLFAFFIGWCWDSLLLTLFPMGKKVNV